MLLQIQFLHPEFLYGLTLLTVPIVLHLFSLRRYKKVYFSNFNFLEALQQQRKNSSRLKNLLLLLLRLVIISCIVLAFATPYINPEHKLPTQPETNQVIIYADNSFSMSNTGSRGTLLEESKKYLFDIINNYPNGTRFRLLTNEAANDLVLTKEQIANALGELKITPDTKPLSQVIKESRELKGRQPATLFIISDFQKKNCDFQHIVQDSTMETIFLVIKPENQSNVYINGVKFDQAFHQKNQNDKIHISVINASDREFHNLPVTLTINGKKKSISQIDIPARSEKKISISYLNTDDGFYKGIAEITDFPVVFDNKFFFSYGIHPKTNIGYLWQKETNPYFAKLFSDSTTFHFTTFPVNQLATQNLSCYNLLILDNIPTLSSGVESLLQEYLLNGGNLFFIPPADSPENLNRFLQKLQAPQWTQKDTNTTITHLETQASLFKNVLEQEDAKAVLPRIRHFYVLSTPTGTEKLLTDKKNHTLLAAKTLGKGNLYVSAFNFNPDNSDMVYHPLFVPLMANMACQVNSALNTSYQLNTEQNVTIRTRNYQENIPLKIQRDDRSFEFIPDIRKNFSGEITLTNCNNIRDAGLYEVIQDNQVIDVLAWNYDRTESRMEFCNEKELQQQFPQARIENIKTTQMDQNSNLVKEIVLQDNNKYLTFWFILLAVAFLLAEQIVWKRKLN